jgi:phosphatidylinositol 3,5-bisphosphate 5-phosphatase
LHPARDYVCTRDRDRPAFVRFERTVGRSVVTEERRMYENLLVYETRARYYLLSYTQDKTRWRVLKISRTEASELDVSEDPVEYSERQAAALLHTLAEGNAGLSLVHRAFGCVGAIRFLEGHYLILVKQRRQVGVLAGHPVYAVEGTEVVELCHPSVKPLRSADEEYAEKRYLRLLELVDLRRHFYYSYGYPLTCSLQRSALGGEQPGECWASLFCWNAHLAQPLAACLGGAASPALSRWVLPLIHGWFGSLPLALCGTPCTLTLLARRSRLFAGTRYRKRGVSDAGNVANDVETEQARGG